MTDDEKTTAGKVHVLLLGERDRAYIAAHVAAVSAVCVYAARVANRRSMTDRQVENFNATIAALVKRAKGWNRRGMISDNAFADCERHAHAERDDTIKLQSRKVRNDGA